MGKERPICSFIRSSTSICWVPMRMLTRDMVRSLGVYVLTHFSRKTKGAREISSSAAINRENRFSKVMGTNMCKDAHSCGVTLICISLLRGGRQDAEVPPQRQEGSGIHRHVSASGNWLRDKGLSGGQLEGELVGCSVWGSRPVHYPHSLPWQCPFLTMT